MIIINKSNLTTRLIFTTSAIGSIPTDSDINLYSDFDKKSYVFQLGNDISMFKERYSEFIIQTSEFIELLHGIYSFKVTSDGLTYNIGMLKVVDAILTEAQEIEETYTSIVPSDTDDDFVVFD